MERLIWHFNRLRQMSPGEIGFRLAARAKVQAEKYGLTNCLPPPPTLKPSGQILSGGAVRDPAPYLASADALLEGKFDLFSFDKAPYGFPPDWNRDLSTGKTAPLIFGKTLDYRNSQLVGDIKYLWEPNRHLHLVSLAQAYRLSSDSRYLDGIGILLRSWFEQCPYPKGPNWTSSLELGIRLINWSITWQLIGGAKAPMFHGPQGQVLLEKWLNSIYRHAHFIRGNFSRFSSANNHLIGEASGLFIATCTWPFWDRFQNWQTVAHRILVKEARKQTYPDGVNKEQATSYQQFVIDLLLLSALAGGENSVDFPPEYWKVIETMMDFLASVMDVAGNVPQIGDADDGYAVRLSQEPDFCPYRSLLATGAVLFRRGEFKSKAGNLDDKTRWLIGDKAEATFKTVSASDASLPVRRAFPQGGYYLLGCRWETDQEIRLLADAGPLGYRSIAAHGHADALAFTLNAAGREILIDPGTYAYHRHQKWRNYFRGTSAHNTLRVDRLDQSVPGGNFLWMQKANASCELWQESTDECRFVGAHDGYLRLADPVRHRREIVLRKTEGRIVVIDTLECSGEHLVERFWHFAKPCLVREAGTELFAENQGIRLVFHQTEGSGHLNLVTGRESPPCGWVSRRYDEKEPITTAIFRNRIHGSCRLISEIELFICS